MIAGFAGVLAIVDEFIQRFCRRKPPVVELRRSTVNEKPVAPPSPPKAVDPPSPQNSIDLPSPPKHPSSPPKKVAPSSPFDQLCENIKDLPPVRQTGSNQDGRHQWKVNPNLFLDESAESADSAESG